LINSFSLCLCAQTVESEKLLKPILSPEEAPGTTRTHTCKIMLLLCVTRVHLNFCNGSVCTWNL